MKSVGHSAGFVATWATFLWAGAVLAAPAVDGTWTNYGNGWFGAGIQGQGNWIWVSGASGVSKYDRTTLKEIGRWGCQDGLIGLNQFTVCDLDPGNGELWVTRFGGVSRWNGSTWHHGTEGWCSYAIAITPEHVWTGAGALNKFDKSGRLVKSYTPGNSTLPAAGIWFLRVDRDDSNYLWIAHFIHPTVQGKTLGYGEEAETWWRNPGREPLDARNLGGLSKWDIRGEKCVAFYHPNNSPVPVNRGGVLAEDRAGRIWFSGDPPSSGIGRFNKRTAAWEIFTEATGCPAGNRYAWSLVLDSADNAFMSTGDNEIFTYWNQEGAWETLRIPPRASLHADLAKYRVNIMQNWNQWGPGDGSVYCATAWGLAFYHRASKTWKWADDLEQAGNIRFGPILDVGQIAEEGEGRIWLAGRTLGCLEKDGAMRIFPVGRCLDRHNDRLSSLAIVGSTLWAVEAELGGVVRFDIAAKTHEYYQGPSARKFGLAGDRASAVGKDRAGRVWFGLRDAAVVQSFDGRAFTMFGKEQTGGQLTGAVTFIKEDPRGNLWLATTDALIKYDGKRWTRYATQVDGKDLAFADIDFDGEGNVWVLGKPVYWRSFLYRFDGRRFEMLGPKQPVTMVLADREGRIWTSDSQHSMLVRHGTEWAPILPVQGGPGGTNYRCGFQGRDRRLYFGGNAYSSCGINLTVLKSP